VITLGSSFLFHPGQRRLQVLGLQAAAGVLDQFPDKQPLGLVVGHIEVAAVTAIRVAHRYFDHSN
jgi:hypothetical protein